MKRVFSVAIAFVLSAVAVPSADADLATVPAPANEDEAQKAEWLALGTFTVSSGENDVDPTRMVQLAAGASGRPGSG